MDSQQWMALSEKHVAKTYNRYPIVLVKGRGTRVWDVDGKEYLDFVAGLAVCGLGHSAFDKVFFCNSGAEANEGAMKLARKYAKEMMGEDRYEIITMDRSFHGRTFATLTATAQEKFHKGFSPLMPGFKYVSFNDLDAVRKAVDSKTCAILVEPIQGEGGVNCPGSGYLEGLRKICDENGLLLIFDEVQVGMGRTGKLFAYEHYGIEPDIMTLAKSLAGGVPIGALLMKEAVAEGFKPGDHASTFGGNPLATAAGVAAFQTILEEGMVENSRDVGAYFLSRLQELAGQFEDVREVRGKGLILGMELKKEGASVVKEMLEKGFLINCTMGNVLRFLPPLIVTRQEVDRLIEALRDVLGKMG